MAKHDAGRPKVANQKAAKVASQGMADERYLTAQQAARRLGVSLQTLYAYVSRGLLRSEPAAVGSRARRYPRQDVARLQQRREMRRNPEQAVPKALHWGMPVLESAITLVADGRLYYRGHDAITLARDWSLEKVAALIWTGESENAAQLFSAPAVAPPALAALTDGEAGLIERCQAALPLCGATDLASFDLRPAAVAASGARIFRLLVGLAAGRPAAGEVGAALAASWAPTHGDAAAALRTALILCADHELNVSAFTVRCVASAGAAPYDVVAAGLAALKGGHHGGHTARVEALLREVATPRAAHRALADRLRRGETIPGFGHPLYPAGDPRGKALLDLAAEVAPDSSELALVRAVIDAGHDLVGEYPTLDVGLVALARALALPPSSPLALFALGRTIGWVGHAIEQYARGRLIRPRAHYVGPHPGAGA